MHPSFKSSQQQINETLAEAKTDSTQIDPSLIEWGEEIEQGSYSKIYSATLNSITHSKVEVIVKEMFRNDAQHLLQNETTSLAKLNTVSTPIAPYFYGIFNKEENEIRCVVIEKLDIDLYYKMEKKIGWPERYRLIQMVVNAVTILHQEAKIAHLDLKLENIMLTESGEVRLIDFDFSQPIQAKYHSAKGTPEYMAPELFNLYREKISSIDNSAALDIFSLSILMWELAAWKNTCLSLNVTELIDLILKGKREKIPKNIPPHVACAITWGWSQKPEDRPRAQQINLLVNPPHVAALKDLRKKTKISAEEEKSDESFSSAMLRQLRR